MNSNCVRDLDLHNQRFSAIHFLEYCDLWHQVSQTTLQPDTPDNIDWKLTADGMYTTKSAYDAQFLGSTSTNFENLFWKAWPPPKCKVLKLTDRLGIDQWVLLY